MRVPTDRFAKRPLPGFVISDVARPSDAGGSAPAHPAAVPTFVPPDAAGRLALAIDHLSPKQVEALRLAQEERSLPGGLKAVIAALAGLPTPSVLSDILARRTPGIRHLPDLARVIGLELAWIQGDDTRPPDFLLDPLAAWERWESRIATQWRRLNGRVVADEETRSDARAPLAEEQRLARMLDLPLGHADLPALAALDLVACSFDVVLRFSAALSLASPTDPDRLRYGQTVARLVAERVARALQHARRRYQRFLLPAGLFQVARVALVGLKAQRRHLRKDVRPVEDCIELLWRQQQLHLGRPRRVVPEGFCEDTGRSVWMPLGQLRQRYENDDPDRHWESRTALG